MRDGFVSVAAVTPEVKVADVEFNVDSCIKAATAAVEKHGAKVVALPELCITGATCGDLFYQDALLNAVDDGLAYFVEQTAELDALILVGAPIRVNGKLYDCAVAICSGEILGVVPKTLIPSYNEMSDARWFCSGQGDVVSINLAGFDDIPFGSSQLFCCDSLDNLAVAVEIGEDAMAAASPSLLHAAAGATLIAVLSASCALVGRAERQRVLLSAESNRLACAFMLAAAGKGESTTDGVFAGHNMVFECGKLIAEAAPFGSGVAATEIDVDAIAAERRRISTFETAAMPELDGYARTVFSLGISETKLTREIDAHPFVPDDDTDRQARCEEIFAIQAHALAKRLQHTRSTRAIIGLSGGLDSTLALLVTTRAFDILGLDRAGIIAVTMPGFGTTGRTYNNACSLAHAAGAELREISIADSVRQHFYDIDHDEADHDATYENAQARERTQILMDLSNQEGGLVVGTGDLSELALGWATYNGDHMSMYGVNAAIPKTLVRHLVRYVADTCGDETESAVLYDVLDTPVSPELLPAEADGTIAQKTEDLVGPYELHDFFIYQVLRRGFTPGKVYRLACAALDDTYDDATILKWLKVFYRRFFSQQFKRSCSPDGPAVGSVGVSPRAGLHMPSDAVSALWLAELEEL